MKKASIYIVYLIMYLLIACAGTIPPPVPYQQRITCLIEEVEDLTGIYDKVSPDFETILATKLMQDYTEHFEKGPTPSFDKKIILTNMFTHSQAILETGTSIEKDGVETAERISNANIVIKGTVEQISYDSPSEIEKIAGGALVLGLLGAALSAQANKDIRAGFVEYRINVYELPSEKFLDTFTVQGAFKSTVPNRKEIIKKANENAAEELIYQLNKRVSVHFGKKPKEYYTF